MQPVLTERGRRGIPSQGSGLVNQKPSGTSLGTIHLKLELDTAEAEEQLKELEERLDGILAKLAIVRLAAVDKGRPDEA